jgi:hypothetical protein
MVKPKIIERAYIRIIYEVLVDEPERGKTRYKCEDAAQNPSDLSFLGVRS